MMPDISAYIRAAESLAAQTEPLERLVAKKRLREIPGIGEAIAAVIEQLHRIASFARKDARRNPRRPRSSREKICAAVAVLLCTSVATALGAPVSMLPSLAEGNTTLA